MLQIIKIPLQLLFEGTYGVVIKEVQFGILSIDVSSES
jgi:hypothetical protein